MISWVPKNPDLLTTSVGIFTILSALMGFVLGITQISRAASARSTLSWINASLDKEKNKHRKALLNKTKIACEGYLFSIYYVPWRYFKEAIVWIITGLIAIIYMLFFRDIFHENTFAEVVTYFAVSLLNLTMMGVLVIRLYIVRFRIIHSYESGIPVETIRTCERDRSGYFWEYFYSFICSLGVIISCIYCSLIIAGHKECIIWGVVLVQFISTSLSLTVQYAKKIAIKQTKELFHDYRSRFR